jgi:hypothetical protein
MSCSIVAVHGFFGGRRPRGPTASSALAACWVFAGPYVNKSAGLVVLRVWARVGSFLLLLFLSPFFLLAVAGFEERSMRRVGAPLLVRLTTPTELAF